LQQASVRRPNCEAAKRRDAIARQLTPSQLADAQRLERDWKAKPEPLPTGNAAALAGAASRSPTVGQSPRADCADLNRQATPNNAALEAATEEYKKSVAFHLRETLDDSPPINVISAGVAAITKMLTAMDKVIDYLHSVQDGGCFGKDATAWAAAIRQLETQRDDMRKDRKTYNDILSMMAKGKEEPRPRQK
jgi:hypothetical protein